MVPCSDVYDENSSPTFNIDDGGDGESGSINDERAAQVMEREGGEGVGLRDPLSRLVWGLMLLWLCSVLVL